MFTYTIKGIPLSNDSTQVIVRASITDGTLVIDKNYQLPASSNPAPSDFKTLIQKDIDAFNLAQQKADTLAVQFTTETGKTVTTI